MTQGTWCSATRRVVGTSTLAVSGKIHSEETWQGEITRLPILGGTSHAGRRGDWAPGEECVGRKLNARRVLYSMHVRGRVAGSLTHPRLCAPTIHGFPSGWFHFRHLNLGVGV